MITIKGKLQIKGEMNMMTNSKTGQFTVVFNEAQLRDHLAMVDCSGLHFYCMFSNNLVSRELYQAIKYSDLASISFSDGFTLYPERG